MNNTLPIGLFDSGVGGLTVLDAMRKRMPGEDYLFLGDTARLPYGSKSSETVIRYAVQAASHLERQQIKMLVVACNTVSAVALPALERAYPHIPVVGVLEPGARAACNASRTGRIAVIATESTTRSGAYPRAILRYRPEAQVTSLACPLFVPLAEEAWFDGPIVESIAARYLQPLFETDKTEHMPDCLVLGCTHYPLLSAAIVNVLRTGPAMPVLVDSAATTAEAVQAILAEKALGHPDQNQDHPDQYHSGHKPRQGVTHFFTTDDVTRFANTGSRFLGEPIAEKYVKLVDL